MKKNKNPLNIFFILCNLILYSFIFILSVKVLSLPCSIIQGLIFISFAIIVDYFLSKCRIRTIFKIVIIICVFLVLFLFVSFISFLLSGFHNYNFFDEIVYCYFRDITFASLFILVYYFFDSISIFSLHIVRYVFSTSIFVVASFFVFRYEGDIATTFFVSYFYYAVCVAFVILLLIMRQVSFYTQKIECNFKFKDLMLLLLILVPTFFILFVYTLPEHIDRRNDTGGLFSSDLFSFDFSNYVELKDKIEITDKRVLILEVDNLSKDIISPIYLKRFALEEYKGDDSYHLAKKNVDITSPPISVGNYVWQREGNFLDINQIETMYLLNINYGTLLGSEIIKKIIPKKIEKWQNSPYKQIYSVQVKALEDTDYVYALTCKGQQKFIEATNSNRVEMLLDWGDHNKNKKIQDLAYEITDKYDSFAYKIYAIQDYLKQNYQYSLHPGFAHNNQSQLNYFLFDIKKGYCTYFAFAMVTMLRSIGIVSRVAVGFAPDDENKTLNYYDVRSPHAHAWVEVYFDDIGWMTFDPTSSNLADDGDYMGVQSQEEDRNALIEAIIDNKQNLSDITNYLIEGSVFDNQSNKVFQQKLRRSGVIFLILFVLFIVGWILCYFFRMQLKLLFVKDSRRKTQLYYKLLLIKLKRHHYEMEKNESVSQFALRLFDSGVCDIRLLTELYLQAEYSTKYNDENYISFDNAMKQVVIKKK